MCALEPSYENIIKQELEVADLKRAIAEKDREIAYLQSERLSAAAMGDQIDRDYHTLMGQAVEFAENTIYIMGALCQNRHELESNSHVLRARAFLASPEVQAWRERKDEKTRLQNNIHRSPSHLEAVPIPEPEEEP